MSTLDVLEELRGRDVLTNTEWLAARNKLRIGGAALMPVHTSEVAHAARRSRAAISAEMKAIQQSIDLARVADVPTFPREVQWFASTSMAIKAAVIETWKSEADSTLAGRLSNLIMSVAPRPQDWTSSWEAGPPSQWVDAVDRVIMASLAVPVELAGDDVLSAYNAWFEQNHLEPLRSVWPEKYRAIVEQVRSFIMSVEDDNEEEETEKNAKSSSKPPKEGKPQQRRKSVRKVKAKALRETKA